MSTVFWGWRIVASCRCGYDEAARFVKMKTPFVDIDSVASLDEFLATANGGAAVLFKHSETCGVSARAHTEMSRIVQPVGLVSVQRARSVSDEIEKRWRVPHETPQVLIVRDGKLLWNASHSHVRAEAVGLALVSSDG
jgi:monothiol bacilliredoxin